MYKNLANVYDKLVYDIDYKKWMNFVEEVLIQNGLKPLNILDLACGTGNITLELAKKGYNMYGIDISSEMLSHAEKKFSDNNIPVNLFKQNIINFNLNRKFSLIICMLDSLNHITDYEDLKLCFLNISNHLKDNGLFIFDINSEYKFKNIFADNVFYEVDDEISYIWQNDFNEKSRICEFDLTFFVRHKEHNLYERFDDYHKERAYSIDEIYNALENSNLKIINKYGDINQTKAYNRSERIFFVCKKLYCRKVSKE